MSNTIFMIHGMWGTSEDWENYRRFFEARRYRCVATTLPYHDMDPRSTPDPRLGTASVLDYAAAVEREIRQLGAKPIVMGHSMGGLLAQMMGERGLAERVVALTPASPAGILCITPSVTRSFWSIMTKWAFWRKPTRQTFAEAVYSMMHLMPESERKAAYDKLVYESGRATFEIGYWFLDARRATRVDGSKVACPMLVVGASQDRITPASVVRQVAKKYKAVATYKEFSNHAHSVLNEPRWEEVAEYVAGWLKQP